MHAIVINNTYDTYLSIRLKIDIRGLVLTKDYCITGRANPISCAVGLR